MPEQKTNSQYVYIACVSSIPAPIAVPQTLSDPVKEPVKSKDQRKSDLERMHESFKEIKLLQDLADEYGIVDIFQDNGGKVLSHLNAYSTVDGSQLWSQQTNLDQMNEANLTVVS